jgi:hypothetical protein
LSKEIITATKTGKFSTAVEVAKGLVGDLGDDAVEKIGKFGSQEGKAVGWQAKDGSKGWRIDYDKNKGAHINWWDGDKKGAVLFKTSEAVVDKIIINEIPKSLK